MKQMIATAVVSLCCLNVAAQTNSTPEEWRPGRGRELLVNGIDTVKLPEWAEAGVNCVWKRLPVGGRRSKSQPEPQRFASATCTRQMKRVTPP